MRYSEINEAPIEDFSLLNNFNRPGSFDDTDRKALQNKKYITSVVKKFQTIPYNFNFYFLNLDTYFIDKYDVEDEYDETIPIDHAEEFNNNFNAFTDHVAGIYNDINDLKTSFTNVNKYTEIHTDFSNLNLSPIQIGNGISCLFLSNANPQDQNKIGLTPWILIHRLAHGINDSNMFDMFTGKFSGLDRTEITTKSGRNGTLANSDKFEECFTQYVYTGKLIFKTIDPEPYENMIKQILSDINGKLIVTI